MNGSPRIAVVGAGAFGGWTALSLARRGASVRLVDAWAPGHPRSSSGGHTRIIRATYGSHEVYTRLAIRAMESWRALAPRAGEPPLVDWTGAVWLFGDDNGFGRASAAALEANGARTEWLSPHDCHRRYPAVDIAGVSSVLIEPDAGYVFARRACEHVARLGTEAGVEYAQAAAVSPVAVDGRGRGIRLTDGTPLEADAYVFACGPWLPALFPDAIGERLLPTRQEIYYFGGPAGDRGFLGRIPPIWLDLTGRVYYGIAEPSSGFKIADDTPGRAIDPTSDDRTPTPAGIASARAFLVRRFPALSAAPLLSAEVCQYESTPDANFIIDRHPAASNVWLVGGGSGHGFKMGPAIGEIVAGAVLDDAAVEPTFGLARFAAAPADGWTPKWA